MEKMKYNLVIGDPSNALQYRTKRKVETEFGRTVRFFKRLGYTIENVRIGYAIATKVGEYGIAKNEIYINRNF